MSEFDMKAAADLGGVSALAATCRLILFSDNRTFAGWAGFFVIGIFAGQMVGWAIESQGYSDGWNRAIVCATALSAKEVLMAVIKTAEMLRDNAAALAARLVRARVNKTTGEPPV